MTIPYFRITMSGVPEDASRVSCSGSRCHSQRRTIISGPVSFPRILLMHFDRCSLVILSAIVGQVSGFESFCGRRRGSIFTAKALRRMLREAAYHHPPEEVEIALRAVSPEKRKRSQAVVYPSCGHTRRSIIPSAMKAVQKA